MSTTFLNIALALESDEPLEELQARLHQDIEYALEEWKCKVFSVTWDRDQALAFVEAQSPRNGHEVLTPQPLPFLAEDVTAVLRQYNLTLPKTWVKKGAPVAKVPKNKVFGEVYGLPNLRGEVVLTNGIMAFLVRQDGAWYHVHWNNIVPDDLDAIDESLPKPCRPFRDRSIEETFAEF